MKNILVLRNSKSNFWITSWTDEAFSDNNTKKNSALDSSSSELPVKENEQFKNLVVEHARSLWVETIREWTLF